jgi:lysophospholipase L1-like esterase
VDKLVIQYRPRAVVLYAGDNDLDERTGKPAEDVVRDFRTFVARVRVGTPDARIYFVSIKPSPLRYCDWSRQREANQQIRAICAADPDISYIDVAGPMSPEGEPPSRSLFVFDGLHLSAEGYALWTRIIKPRLLTDLEAFAPALDDAL